MTEEGYKMRSLPNTRVQFLCLADERQKQGPALRSNTGPTGHLGVRKAASLLPSCLLPSV